MRFWIPFTIVLFISTLAVAADVKPARVRVNNRCSQFTMCNAEAGTGVCQESTNTDEIVHHVGLWANYTFSSIESGASDYSCDVLTNLRGGAGTNSSDQVNTTSITDNDTVYIMRVLLRYFWITCSLNTGADITIKVVICPL